MRRIPETTRNSGVTLAARLAHAPPRLLYREILNCRCALGDAKPQTKLLVPVAVPRQRERCGIGHRCETGEGLVLRQTAIERVGGRIRNTPPKSGGDNNARELRWLHGIPWVLSGPILTAAARLLETRSLMIMNARVIARRVKRIAAGLAIGGMTLGAGALLDGQGAQDGRRSAADRPARPGKRAGDEDYRPVHVRGRRRHRHQPPHRRNQRPQVPDAVFRDAGRRHDLREHGGAARGRQAGQRSQGDGHPDHDHRQQPHDGRRR